MWSPAKGVQTWIVVLSIRLFNNVGTFSTPCHVRCLTNAVLLDEYFVLPNILFIASVLGATMFDCFCLLSITTTLKQPLQQLIVFQRHISNSAIQ